MNWYYVENGQQAGPVDDANLEELARMGKVQADTLVWREGMPNWQPYRDVGGGGVVAPPLQLATGTPISGQEAVCSECGRIFNKQEMITYGNAQVCAGCKPVFMQKLAEGAQVNVGAMHYAGFWIRLGAKLLDGIILGVVFIPIIMYFAFQSMAGGPGQPPNLRYQLLQVLAQLGLMVANIIYSIFFLGKYGATPGKMVCGVKVVTAEGAKITFGRATGRAFAEILSGLICDIGYIIAGFDSEKRALHDHICNTRVVYK